MPAKGGKSRFSAKEDRQAQHIIESEEARGVDEKTARSIAYGHLTNVQRMSGHPGAKGHLRKKGV
jgi:hypothetical protein